MATVKGQNLRIYIGGKPIAAALECTMHASLNVQQMNTKDDEGAWARNVAVSLQWDSTAQGVVENDTTDTDAEHASSIMSYVGKLVRIQFALASGTKNREQGQVLCAGDAILRDVQVQAQNRQRPTYQIQLTGAQQLLYDLREILTADGHNIRTADGHIVMAPHQV
jgi:hypothetical protein